MEYPNNTHYIVSLDFQIVCLQSRPDRAHSKSDNESEKMCDIETTWQCWSTAVLQFL